VQQSWAGSSGSACKLIFYSLLAHSNPDMSFKALAAFTICQPTPELLRGTIDFCMSPCAQAATPGMLIFMDRGGNKDKYSLF
jgi:hypothetical protein